MTTQEGSSKSINRALTFAYRVDNGIYINLTNRCSNNCTFCLRNNSDGAYGSDSLWLEREPTPQEAFDAVKSIMFDECREFVFCGYGEPTCRIDALTETASMLKHAYNIPIRINTNGQANIINRRDVIPSLSGLIDVVSISLNTADAESYVKLCRPAFGEEAYQALIDFGRGCVGIIPEVVFTVVEETLTKEQLAICADTVKSSGATLRIRKYISDNNQIPE